MSKAAATFLGVGLIPFAPGTFGSAAAVVVWFFFDALYGLPLVLAGIVLAYLVGVWATTRMTEGTDNHDPSEIVIDEVVGQWIALLPISMALVPMSYWTVGLAFVLFRLFDITKLGPVGWADDLNTPTGVMLDDVLAGVAAAICLAIVSLLLT